MRGELVHWRVIYAIVVGCNPCRRSERQKLEVCLSPLSKTRSAESQSSVESAEIAKFSALAAQWWDPAGKFGVLHKFNPVRLAYIREQATAWLGRDPMTLKPFAGLRVLDIGCGGGLLSEPMARLGADVVGVDPSERNIASARIHAAEQELAIDYRAGTAEALAAEGERFDIILNMEVVEHVVEPARFLETCSSMLNSRGVMFVATINRTFRSFALAIVGAEYILGWLPKGTHQWEKFITPAEMESTLTVCRPGDPLEHRRHLQPPDRQLVAQHRSGSELHGGRAEALIGVFGKLRERLDFDALFRERFGLIQRRLAIDCLLLHFLIVDAPRLFGKAVAHIMGIVLDETAKLAHHFHHFGMLFVLLSREHRHRCFGPPV